MEGQEAPRYTTGVEVTIPGADPAVVLAAESPTWTKRPLQPLLIQMTKTVSPHMTKAPD